MQVVMDEHVKSVLEYMQAHVPENKLIGVSERLPELARLLWSNFQQEPVSVLNLSLPKATSDRESQSLSTAIG